MCYYGCGQEASYQFKNGKWCCSKFLTQCPIIRKKNSETSKGSPSGMLGKHLSDEHKKKISSKMKGRFISNSTRKKISKFQKGKFVSDETKDKISKSRIGKYKGDENPNWKGGYFSIGIPTYNHFKNKLVEEMRRNEKDKNILEVRCSYNKCKKWFVPRLGDVYHRVETLNSNKGMGENRLYCSDECKKLCSIFGINYDPFESKDSFYSHTEYQIFRQEVLNRQKDEYGYNFCEYCELKENLHVHHEKPKKTNQMMALDPDNGIILCEECHFKIGHRPETECSTTELLKCRGEL